MQTAVKSAFDRIDKEYSPVQARGGTRTAPPMQPSGPSTGGPGPYGGGYPGGGPAAPYAPGYGAPGTAPRPGGPSGPGGWGRGGGGWGGGGWGGGAWGPGGPSPVGVRDTRPFSSARTFDKLIVLTIIALVSGVVGYVAVPTGAAFACMVGAFVLVLVSWFRMRWARVIAPAYAVLEGVALGAISGAYATLGHGIVPLAIVFTAAVFVGALVLYRTGLVRVTPRMMSLAFMGALGLVAVGVLSLLGLSLPGVNSFGTAGLLFGIVVLAIGVLNLFTDFEYVNRSERLGVSADAEWAAAFAIMTALVLVYISILRIAGAAYGGGGGRRR